MVSSKERLRLDRLFNKQADALARQKKSIDRLVVLNTGLSAALFEIADGPDDMTAEQMRQAAQDALANLGSMSAAVREQTEESGNVPEDEAPSLSEEK